MGLVTVMSSPRGTIIIIDNINNNAADENGVMNYFSITKKEINVGFQSPPRLSGIVRKSLTLSCLIA